MATARPASLLMAAALAALCLPGQAVAEGRIESGRTQQTPLGLYQAKDQRLQDIGWQLAWGNAPFCDKTKLSIGLQLLDVAGFGDPDAVRTELGGAGDFSVQTVARGSPAAAAGIAARQAVVDIDGTRPGDWPAQPRYDWERLKRAHDLIDAALAESGTVAVGLASDERAQLRGVAVCATRFEMETGSDRAVAEGERVVIGDRFPGLAYTEREFAGAIAHELAHNLLRHRAWLEANGRKRKNIRLTEREADRLMPWLLANAGYDPVAAVEFMQRWGPRHSGGIFRKRTHDGWDERAEFIAAELPQVERLMREEGAADWAAHFRREVEP